jgi:hypothetical protein
MGEAVEHQEIVSLGPVMRHQQPAREALVDLVPPVAGRRTRNLPVMGQRVAGQQGAESGEAM